MAHRSYGAVEFILALIPFVFSCLLVIVIKGVNESYLAPSEVFLTISMMIAVTVPLRFFSGALRQMRMFLVAYRCTSKFFEVVEYRQGDGLAEDCENIGVGELSMIDCFYSADQGGAVMEINNTFNQSSKTNKKKKYPKKPTPKQTPRRVGSISAFSNLLSSNRRTLKPQNKSRNGKEVLRINNFYVDKGEKICVIGKEGSGKLYFFQSILGELQKESGTFSKNGRVVLLDMENQKYLKGTIRDNIVLGEEYLADRFLQICEVVGLNLDKYEGRDLTEIIEG